jgi:RimJ/RimL family protein N-acetyltransferase
LPDKATAAVRRTIPPMSTQRVRLRPINERDRAFLYELMTAPEAGGRVRFAGATPSPEKVAASLWDSVLAQFVIEGVSEGQPFGLVAITSANFRDGFAYVSALGLPAAQGPGLLIEAVLLAFNYAFLTWPFRKIYMESTEDSFQFFRSGLGRFFQEEGRLREHSFWNGRYVDVLILAVYREVWEREAETLAQQLRAPASEPTLVP